MLELGADVLTVIVDSMPKPPAPENRFFVPRVARVI
jgi:hypothetical protein